jgi:alkylation response protein AidB-like acyl-CoA dehydrogenase
MDFALSAEQQQFAASLHDMLLAADGPSAARSWAAGDHKPGLEIWRSLAEAGVTGLMVPSEHGGLGAHPVDLVLACEEIGHHAVPGPVAESLAAVPKLLGSVHMSRRRYAPTPGISRSARAVAVPRGEPQDQISLGSWLQQLAAGELLATLASEPWLPLAADADVAGLVLLAEPELVSLGVAGQSQRSVDAARTLAAVSPGELIADGPEVAGAVARALDFGALACAAQLLGLGRALLELTASHARQRVQFGQPVGSFQAVKHQLADALIGLEFARPLVFGAAISLASASAGKPSAGNPSAGNPSAGNPTAGKLSAGKPSAGKHGAEPDQAAEGRDVSAAKVACAQAASRAARTALQVHGAIGYTAEHDVSIYLTKIRALVSAWGSQAQHRARVLAALTSAQTPGGS